MLAYWILFSYFAAGALLSRPGRNVQSAQGMALVLGTVLIALLVGFRYKVGGDWQAYVFWFEYAEHADLGRMLALKDPGYQLLNWGVQYLGGQLWLVNLVCGAIFAWGLARLCATQPDPMTAMLVAIPYLVIVVGMGYSRQAVALGILMAGLASLIRGSSTLRFIAYVAVAALFHRTAVIVIPIVALAVERNRWVNLAIAGASGVLLYDSLLKDSMDVLVENYIRAEYQSEGAGIRLAMTLVPSIIFLLASRRLAFPEQERRIWRNHVIAAFVLLTLFFVLPSSTAVDRIALYVSPLQMAVLSRVPGRLLSEGLGRTAITLYCAFVLFIWLNFATHAGAWVPYQFFPL